MATTFTINERQIDGVQRAPGWIRNGLDREAIEFAEAFGIELTGKKGSSYKKGERDALSTSQIRNVFGEVQRLRMKGFDEAAFLLLKPRLVYAAERNSTGGSRDFKKVIVRAIDAVLEAPDPQEKAARFERFADFFEAILAYHRAFGGK